MVKRWRIHPHDPARIRDIEQVAGVSPVIAQILSVRGVTNIREIRRFLEARLTDLAPPDQLPGCISAAKRIVTAVHEGKCICVYGDYDVDGMTSTAILRRCLKLLGANVRYHIPCRMDEGYGLHDDYLRRVAQSDPGAVVITVDCGITSIEQAQTAKELGLELIITDHHEPGETLPEVGHIVHPRLPGVESGFELYSGAGVAMKLAWAICQEYWGAAKVPTRFQEFLVQAVGIAALGTIADVVPLLGDNRILVKNGLKLLQCRNVPTSVSGEAASAGTPSDDAVSGGVSSAADAPSDGDLPGVVSASDSVPSDGDVSDSIPSDSVTNSSSVGASSKPTPRLSCITAGIYQLLRVAELTERSSIEAEDVAFRLAPRLNAAGRLGQALLAAELLITDDPQRATDLANHVDKLNNDRQTLERKVYLGADRQAKERFDPENDPALVLADRDWHPGVVGIVAGRLAEKYNRPTILISQDPLCMRPGTGSARGVPELNLVEALGACREYLVRCGGHASAAGLAIEDAQINAFRNAFCDYVADKIGQASEPELMIDAEVPIGMVNEHFLAELDRLAPFGQANRRPILCATRVYLAEKPRCIGNGQNHLSLTLMQGNGRIRGVAFGAGSRAVEFEEHVGAWDIAFRPVWNVFRGRRSVELHLEDWRPSEP